MKILGILLISLILNGCAIVYVRTNADGTWSAYGGSVLKETNIPSLVVTNASTTISLHDYSSKNEAAKEALNEAIKKIP